MKPVAERVLPLLPIGTEGERIFDLGLIVDILKSRFGVTQSLAWGARA